MLHLLCKAKLNKAWVTSLAPDHSGSLAVDGRVLNELGVYPYEKVLVVNREKGHRFETYVVPAPPGEVILQGGAALLGDVGDIIGFLAFAVVGDDEDPGWKPRVVELRQDGRIEKIEL